MDYYIGIDGGGTKTKAVLIDDNLKIISEDIGGPSNFLVFDIDTVANSLIELIGNVLNKGNIDSQNVKKILLGTAGAGRKEDAERLENKLYKVAKTKSIIINNFKVESDARIALEGAFAGKPGSILIAGTGSIMFGKDSNGKIHRVGGFGRLLGDEGSGFHIGRAGLNAVAKSFDGRANKTLLTDLVKEKFDIANSTQLINEVYKNNFDIPQVAPLVIDAALKGDKICTEILNAEVDELIAHIVAMKEKIKTDVLNVSLIGGTITTDNFYAEKFRNKINELPKVKLKEAELPPDMGAALLAKENNL
jgi:N-acetylglucosamine kinase